MPRVITKTHSYEEIRATVIDILLGEPIKSGLGNYDNLVLGVAEVLIRRGAPSVEDRHTSGGTGLKDQDVELVRDVFWDLFRQGIVILGRNDMNQTWPSYRLSHHATETLLKKSPYRFHDTASYLKLVRNDAPDVSDDAVAYLEEAVSTYYADCLLSCCVMIGVAAEIEFNRMIDAGSRSSHATLFKSVEKERFFRKKVIAFQKLIPQLPSAIPKAGGEDLDVHLNGIQSVLRVSRNKAGHALFCKPPMREQVYINLQLFVQFLGYVTRIRLAL